MSISLLNFHFSFTDNIFQTCRHKTVQLLLLSAFFKHHNLESEKPFKYFRAKVQVPTAVKKLPCVFFFVFLP